MKSLTQREAAKICRKLSAQRDTERTNHHDYYVVTHNGKKVVKIGVRRASKEKGHGHLPGELHLTQSQTLELARCPMSKDEYFDILQQKGVTP